MELVYSYMIYQLAVRYIRLRDNDDTIKESDCIEMFNISNNFDKKKLSLLPFLICIANGSKDELIEEFEKHFFPLDFGIANLTILKDLKEKTKYGSIKQNTSGSFELVCDYDYFSLAPSTQAAIDKSIRAVHFHFEDFALKNSDEISFISKGMPIYHEYRVKLNEQNSTDINSLIEEFNSELLSRNFTMEVVIYE